MSIVLLAQAPVLDFQLQTLSGPSLSTPVDIANAHDGTNRIFVVEKRGTIRIIANGAVSSSFFLNIQARVLDAGERGLLGLTFHPNYPATPYFFVNYVDNADSTVIARFEVNPNDANDALENSEVRILTQHQPSTNHNGGDLDFGPDGFLYIAFGDGGSQYDPDDFGQDSTSFLGKMLRIDVDNGLPYTVPASNPFTTNPAVLDEIWSIGFRNPWRFSFDRSTGDLWIADVGQDEWEEVNCVSAASIGGENYGWRCYEGNAPLNTSGCLPANAYTFPIFAYPHPGNIPMGWELGSGRSVTGGFVYRGSEFPMLQGYYICADYNTEDIWLIQHSKAAAQITVQDGGTMFNALTTFGESEGGELYAADISGDFYRVAVDAPLPLALIRFDAERKTDIVQLEWEVESPLEILSFEVERSDRSLAFASIGTVRAERKQKVYGLDDDRPLDGLSYYRLKTTLADGSVEYSSLISLVHRSQKFDIQVRTGLDGNMIIAAPSEVQHYTLSIFDIRGALIQSLGQIALADDFSVEGSAQYYPGVYVAVLEDATGQRDAFKWIKK